MPREPAADSIQGRLPSCNDASGTSGAQKAEELAAALDRERALRQQHEQALEAALDEVMERSRLLQRRMDRGSIRHTLDGELGSPRRLQSLARRGGTEDPFEEGEVLNRLGHEEMDDEVREREPSTSSQHRVRFASTAFTIAHEVPNRHHRQHLPPPRQQPSPQEDMGEVVHALRSELAHQTAEINAMRASGKQLEAELAATRQALDGARGVASARGEALRRLLRLTGGHEAGGLLEEVGDQQRTEAEQEAWAERAGRLLGGWIEEHRRQRASACLSEERLRAEALAARREAEGSETDAHRRAERAEARCKHLVAALRATQRGIVDAVQGDMPMAAGGMEAEPGAVGYYDADVPPRAGGSEQAARQRRHRTAVWERQRAWAHVEAVQREAARGSAAAKVRDHLLVPVMRVAAGGGSTSTWSSR